MWEKMGGGGVCGASMAFTPSDPALTGTRTMEVAARLCMPFPGTTAVCSPRHASSCFYDSSRSLSIISDY